MGQAYSDPSRAGDPYSLPDIETFFHQHAKRDPMALNAGDVAKRFGECITDADGDCCGTGWYWQACFPGCMPDSDPFGPFKTEADAIKDAQEVS